LAGSLFKASGNVAEDIGMLTVLLRQEINSGIQVVGKDLERLLGAGL